MVSGRVESIQLSDLCSDDDRNGPALEKCMGSTGYAFYYVQIAPHKYGNSRNINSALLQEAQMKALQTIPNSGMIPTIDVGDEFCIHPPQKM